MGVRGLNAGLRPAVFLDRDGTLNRAFERDGVSVPPDSVDEVELLPGVGEALRRLAAAGLPLIVVTNQPDVARGMLTCATLDQINERLMAQLPLSEIVSCCHDDADNCACRKPSPGMLLDAARRHGLDLGSSFLVGDRWKDVEAGRRAGCATILLRTARDERSRCRPDYEADDLGEAAEIVLGRLPQVC